MTLNKKEKIITTTPGRFVGQFKILVERLFFKIRAHSLLGKGEAIKVVIGSGPTNYNGWLMTDLPILDALKSSDWSALFPIASIDRILAEHVIEHWSAEQFCLFLNGVRPFLSKQGFIRLAVPDGFHPGSDYIDYVKPGGGGGGADDHKVLYTYKTLAAIVAEMRYDCKFLEYFDETGRFHQITWLVNDGFIHRSANNDPRNRQTPLSYTSLIVDIWPKP